MQFVDVKSCIAKTQSISFKCNYKDLRFDSKSQVVYLPQSIKLREKISTKCSSSTHLIV